MQIFYLPRLFPQLIFGCPTALKAQPHLCGCVCLRGVPQTGSLASGLIHVGLCPLLSPTPEQSGATGALRLASKTQGRETWGYRVMLGGVWGFLNLLFKHLVNIHTAHILKIIYYCFFINYRNCQCFVTWEVKNCFD